MFKRIPRELIVGVGDIALKLYHDVTRIFVIAIFIVILKKKLNNVLLMLGAGSFY